MGLVDHEPLPTTTRRTEAAHHLSPRVNVSLIEQLYIKFRVYSQKCTVSVVYR